MYIRICTNVVQWHGVVWLDVVCIIHSTVVWDMHAYIRLGICTVNGACILQGKGKRFKSKSDLRMYVRMYIHTYIRVFI